jgi:exopolysaccharide biosynthesis operon protein EpsL
LLTLGLSGPRLLYAQTTDTFRPFVRYAAMYDDNVLGLPSEVSNLEALGLEKKSDVSQTLEIGMLLDKQYGRQYFTGTVKAGKTRYETLKALNFDGRDITGNWNWVVGNHLDGNLGMSYARGLTPYTDFHQLVSNVRTQKREYLNGNWRLHPSWRTRAGLSRSTVDYELLSQQSLNRVETRSELGLDFLARSGSSVGLVVAHTSGTHPNRVLLGGAALSNSYQQDEIKANIDWRVSGKTRLQLLAGQVSRSNEDPRIRDFKGFNARLTGDWFATGKLSVNGAVWRETGIVDDLSAVYSINKGVSLAPRWQLSDKSLLEMQFRYQRRDFSQSLAASSTVSGVREDALRSASLVLAYKPLRHLTVQTSIFHAAKSSDLRFNNYTRNGVSISLQQEL